MNKVLFDKFVRVQSSGVVNMVDVKLVSRISGLSVDDCLDIMKNYDRYESGFFDEDSKKVES